MFTLEDMRRFAAEAWGPFGASIVDRWAEFNARYFDGKLSPIPLVLTHTQPYGRRLAFCSYGGFGRTITLNVPKAARGPALLADNSALLHEMVHQALFEADEKAGHETEGWRREIMRLTRLVSGQEVWAGRSVVKRLRRSDGKLSIVARVNEPRPDCGEFSLTQYAIATWPHSVGIHLGMLGQAANGSRTVPTANTNSSPI